jgi:hypothetical protein
MSLRVSLIASIVDLEAEEGYIATCTMPVMPSLRSQRWQSLAGMVQPLDVSGGGGNCD